LWELWEANILQVRLLVSKMLFLWIWEFDCEVFKSKLSMHSLVQELRGSSSLSLLSDCNVHTNISGAATSSTEFKNDLPRLWSST